MKPTLPFFLALCVFGAIRLPDGSLCRADGPPADAEDAPPPMSQLGMAIAAAEDRDWVIGELGRRAAELAWEAGSAAEADAVLSAFRRTLERCIETHRRPSPPDSGTVRPMLDAMETEAIARRQLDIWAATPEQAARWNAAGIPDAAGTFRGAPYRLREGQALVVAPVGPYLGEDPDAYGTARQGLWRLQTFPQWCFRDAGGQGGARTSFLLLAMRLEPDGSPCFGEPCDDDTLLLRWVPDGGRASPHDGQFLGMGLYPLRGTDSVVRSGDRLEIGTAWDPRRDGPAVYLRNPGDGLFLPPDRMPSGLPQECGSAAEAAPPSARPGPVIGGRSSTFLSGAFGPDRGHPTSF